MDERKRAQLEKIGVPVLGAVFIFVFLTGPAKSLGLFKSGVPAIGVPAAVPEPAAQPADAPVASIQPATQAAVPGPDGAKAIPGVTGEPKYTAQSLPDPFKDRLPLPVTEIAKPVDPDGGQPVEEVVEIIEPPSITVQGTVWGSERPKVIIERHVYGIGDSPVEGAEIVAIDSSGLVVEFEGAFFRYAAGSDIPHELDAASMEGTGGQR